MTLGFFIFLVCYVVLTSIWMFLVYDYKNYEFKPTRPYVLPRDQYPECLREHIEVIGIYVGDCLLNDDQYREHHFRWTGINLGRLESPFGLAHAHPGLGWICVEFPSRLQSRDLMLHELAHLKVPSSIEVDHHGPIFRAKVLELGGTLEMHRMPGTNRWGTAFVERHRVLEEFWGFYYELIVGPICRIKEIVCSLYTRIVKGDFEQ